MPAVYDTHFEAMDATVLRLLGETGIYAPKGGTNRAVAAAVSLHQIHQDQSPGNRLVQVEVLEVLVSRDGTSGIDAPQLGDGYAREGDDPAVKAYSFNGDKQDISESHWVLIFIRELTVQVGGNSLPR